METIIYKQIKFYKIKDYPNYYISKYGEVYSKKLNIIRKTFLVNGYKVIDLYKNNKRKHFLISRLVALQFIPNLENKPQVNHIDGNTINNNIDNLEWCTQSENLKHSYRYLNRPNPGAGKFGILNHKSRKINQIDVNTNNIIKYWDSIADAKRKLRLQTSNIIKVCNGEREKCGGFKWEYYDKSKDATK